ncbi:alpha/beta fold hydrolase [Actinokineospora globicatena]|uniref:alpha/beta fold hydrolase n=1 Tax=Actinokineospora globicatena TaxID=103729 RepID=UPI0020A562D6|nr:alpha/beta hydrolase [Actinokineospora globicatena]MCP2304261.1 Pimeloyl-ACP methyl ester carboxylesterase [Actinokineospora globicatena]GLW78377.1 alpha/beta hydrolase [Actinokineospora globicatena]GLW84958.1 alpha/beta hydrolase [Actinokineospora globicatena]
MSTYVLLPGAASDSRHWRLVVPGLRAHGHDVITPDLPCEDDSAGFDEYADVVVAAVRGYGDLVVVAQSMAGFTAPIVATRVPVNQIVLVNAMVPVAGETGDQWWRTSGSSEAMRANDEAHGRDPNREFDPVEVFLHDIPEELWDDPLDQSGTPFEKPWPLERWPDVPTRAVASSGDRLFPIGFQRELLRERLGISPVEIAGGHLPALANPEELVRALL